MIRKVICILPLAVSLLVAAPVESEEPGFAVLGRKTIVDLQTFRQVAEAEAVDAAGARGRARLFNLNQHANRWFLLELQWPGQEAAYFHLENPGDSRSRLVLDPAWPEGLVISAPGEKVRCALWSPANDIAVAQEAGKPFAPLCDGRIYLRNQTAGHRTSMEWMTDFLRDNVWGGEKITTFVRRQFFADAFLVEAPLVPADAPEGAFEPNHHNMNVPASARVDNSFEGLLLEPRNLGLVLGGLPRDKLIPGRWYQHRRNPGVFVSVMQPHLVDAEILKSFPQLVRPLDEVEREALVYTVAFDLSEFDAGFAVGTEHPRVGWSARALESAVDHSMPGPDGIGDISPLVATGMVGPADRKRTVATFAGGFKRGHSAFKYGALSQRNHGSHYGVVEQGVVSSTLQPGLATFIVFLDGTIDMRTWFESDREHLSRIRHARQNGVPLIDHDPATGLSRPGALVSQWGPGNWSGSEDGKLRALRAGVCLQQAGDRRFLLYSYFSTATPSAMARVFQAYACKYALHLDMNALEHTYLAVYRGEGNERSVEHLVAGMEVLDKTVDGKTLPRFLGYADNRDFFYLVRREEPR